MLVVFPRFSMQYIFIVLPNPNLVHCTRYYIFRCTCTIKEHRMLSAVSFQKSKEQTVRRWSITGLLTSSTSRSAQNVTTATAIDRSDPNEWLNHNTVSTWVTNERRTAESVRLKQAKYPQICYAATLTDPRHRTTLHNSTTAKWGTHDSWSAANGLLL